MQVNWITLPKNEYRVILKSKMAAIYHVGSEWHQIAYQYWYRHATISWGESVFLKRKSVSIRIIHQCIDVSRHFVFAGDSHRDAVCKKIMILRNKIKITILLLSLINCNITLMFQFVCTICNAISYATKIRPRRKVSFPPRRQAKINVNSASNSASISRCHPLQCICVLLWHCMAWRQE